MDYGYDDYYDNDDDFDNDDVIWISDNPIIKSIRTIILDNEKPSDEIMELLFTSQFNSTYIDLFDWMRERNPMADFNLEAFYEHYRINSPLMAYLAIKLEYIDILDEILSSITATSSNIDKFFDYDNDMDIIDVALKYHNLDALKVIFKYMDDGLIDSEYFDSNIDLYFGDISHIRTEQLDFLLSRNRNLIRQLLIDVLTRKKGGYMYAIEHLIKYSTYGDRDIQYSPDMNMITWISFEKEKRKKDNEFKLLLYLLLIYNEKYNIPSEIIDLILTS